MEGYWIGGIKGFIIPGNYWLGRKGRGQGPEGFPEGFRNGWVLPQGYWIWFPKLANLGWKGVLTFLIPIY